MAIFNSYAKWPEGTHQKSPLHQEHHCHVPRLIDLWIEVIIGALLRKESSNHPRDLGGSWGIYSCVLNMGSRKKTRSLELDGEILILEYFKKTY